MVYHPRFAPLHWRYWLILCSCSCCCCCSCYSPSEGAIRPGTLPIDFTIPRFASEVSTVGVPVDGQAFPRIHRRKQKHTGCDDTMTQFHTQHNSKPTIYVPLESPTNPSDNGVQKPWTYASLLISPPQDTAKSSMSPKHSLIIVLLGKDGICLFKLEFQLQQFDFLFLEPVRLRMDNSSE